jgi:tyrosyl-tRNA synthetase
MSVIIDKERIDAIFERGVVVNVLPSQDALYERLQSGDRLKIYIGADPTSSALHLSHAKNYMLLEELRQLGHEVIVLFGDFTAQIGDPTDRPDTRPSLDADKVANHVKDWLHQIAPLLDFEDSENPAQVRYNSEWLSSLSLSEVVKLASHFTVQQMMERDMFEKRLQAQTPIHLHEFLYPLMQGYDSVALDVDIELCGTDQTFNALAGRTLQRKLNDKEKFVIAVNLMENPETGELMSKSRGTGVFLASSADEMYGSIMAQPDAMLENLYVNVTRLPLQDFPALMEKGPRLAKAEIAREIVRIFHGNDEAEHAEQVFEQTFAQRQIPDNIPTYVLKKDETLAEVLVRNKVVASKSEFRRLVESGGVRDEAGNKILDVHTIVEKGSTYKIGKRRFVRIEPNL